MTRTRHSESVVPTITFGSAAAIANPATAGAAAAGLAQHLHRTGPATTRVANAQQP